MKLSKLTSMLPAPVEKRLNDVTALEVGACVGALAGGLAFVVYRHHQAGGFHSTLGKLLGLRCKSKRGGHVAKGYEAVEEAFKKNFDDGLELGAQFAVFVKGEKKVDLWGASANSQEYNGDSMQIVWSSSKSVTALVVAVLVSEGKLDYDATIASYWPKFAKHGKAGITVADLMRHEAGCELLCRPITRAMLADWVKGGNAMAQAIEDTTPEWSAESRRCYHSHTRGFIINELVRRVAEGRTVGSILGGLTHTLGINESLRMGIPQAEQAHLPLTPLVGQGGFTTLCKFLPMILGWDAEAKKQMSYFGKGSFAARRWMKALDFGTLTPADGPGAGSAPWFIEAECPSLNVQTHARSLARLFSDVEGFVGAQTLAKALQVTPQCMDVGIGIPTQFCAGGWCKDLLSFFHLTDGWYGWIGWGGSVIQFNPSLGVSFAYTMTAMEPSLTADERSRRLIRALESSLKGAGVA